MRSSGPHGTRRALGPFRFRPEAASVHEPAALQELKLLFRQGKMSAQRRNYPCPLALY